MNKKFEGYVLKNKIPGLVISLVMLAAILCIAVRSELHNKLSVTQLRTFSDVMDETISGNDNITITIDRADYLGFDCYAGSEITGRYYYCSQDGRFVILLLNSTEDIVLNYAVRGRILVDKEVSDEIQSSIAKDIGISKEQLEKKMYPYIISEVDFPRIYYNMLLLVLILALAWFVFNLIMCIYQTICPYRIPDIKASLGKKATRQTISDIDYQIRHNLYFDQDKITITDRYFIYHGLLHTEVVALDSIESFRKLRTSSNIGSGRRRIYKLLMTDVDGVTYEQNFRTEKTLDEAMSYLVK